MLTISDGVTHGVRTDSSGPALAARLTALGFDVTRGLVPDERRLIAAAVRGAARDHVLVVSTGGTGLAPRDVTPQALHELLDYEVPGFGEVMRAEGRRSTPFAVLSRSLAGVLGRTLVVALPGSERGAVESFEAITPLLDHALATLGGDAGPHPPLAGAAADDSGRHGDDDTTGGDDPGRDRNAADRPESGERDDTGGGSSGAEPGSILSGPPRELPPTGSG